MEVRIDKWLWAMRLYKTRSIAAEACKRGRITMNGVTQKPSRIVKEGDVIDVKRPPITFSYKILQLTQNRLSAKQVPDYMLQVTRADQLELLEILKADKTAQRARGTGRPTKKERRDLDGFIDHNEPFFIDSEYDEDLDDLFDEDED
ncbi:MAG: RNA-binding S4 domain-containing protein [Paludibacteraceae bacterium]|nr:RNA-binding S4 domain-containing protein [Paludibacteraceae bacterium]